MKILEIDYDYYYFPDGITSLDAFVDYVNGHYHTFIELTQLVTENCVFPYLITEDTARVYVNAANLNKIQEVEVTVISRAKYDCRLMQIVEKNCKDCVHYVQDMTGDNLRGHRGRISLDGKCAWYQKTDDGADVC